MYGRCRNWHPVDARIRYLYISADLHFIKLKTTFAFFRCINLWLIIQILFFWDSPCARRSSGFHNGTAVPMTFVQLSDSKTQPLVDYYQVQRRPHDHMTQASAGTITYIVIAKTPCISCKKTISILIHTLYTQNRESCVVSMNMTRFKGWDTTGFRGGSLKSSD